MNLQSLIQNNRSYRRFDANTNISEQILLELIDLTRYTSSARNAQPLRYIISNEKEKNDLIFPTLAWAGYLNDWDGPKESERPVAYIIVLAETELKGSFTLFDAGLATQSILLGAVERGFGGCIIGAVNKEKLREILDLENSLEIVCVIALGKPAEKVVVEEMKNNDFKYWRDDKGTHHVPKRSLNDILRDLDC